VFDAKIAQAALAHRRAIFTPEKEMEESRARCPTWSSLTDGWSGNRWLFYYGGAGSTLEWPGHPAVSAAEVDLEKINRGADAVF